MLLFDKSSLQAISLNESVWLEQFFLINITPLFYVEVLADLEKKAMKGKTPENIVRELSNKTPTAGTFSNVHHQTLLLNELLGKKVDMKRRPFVNGGKPTITKDGKIGFHFEGTPEDKALERWTKEQFLEIERETAKEWRKALSDLTFDTMISTVKNTVPVGTHFSNLEQIKKFVDKFITNNDKPTLDFALYMLDIPNQFHKFILNRWESLSRPPLVEFSPYAAYVLSVDMFFYLALGSSFISKERPSNKIDISYLYYLPFCMVFTSRDKLHKRTAPLFMSKGQVFVYGDELKDGLKELDKYYTKYEKEIDEIGVMKFAAYPPQDFDNHITKIWDKFGMGWRKSASHKKRANLPSDKKLLEMFKQQEKDSKPLINPGEISSDEAHHVTFVRRVKVKKGKWRILPKGIENKEK